MKVPSEWRAGEGKTMDMSFIMSFSLAAEKYSNLERKWDYL